MRSKLGAEIEESGFALVKGILPLMELERLRSELRTAESAPSVRRRETGVYALRLLLEAVPTVRRLAQEGPLAELAREVLGEGARPVKAILFDKVEAANWKVPWHQDRRVAPSGSAFR